MTNNTINAILSLIEDNLENDLNIKSISCKTGYSSRHIQNIFKKHIGITPWKYIKHRRVTRAALLLRLTSSSIIDIAYRLQFDSQQSFSREFKKISGMTPFQYRNMKEWVFEPIFYQRAIDVHQTVSPEVHKLNDGSIIGFDFFYEVDIKMGTKPFPLRWKLIEEQLSKTNGPVWLLSEYSFGEKSFDTTKVHTYIGIKDSDCPVMGQVCHYPSGYYIHFKKTGTIDEYMQAVDNMYLKTLPNYKVKRKAGFDIEVIS
ncbi:helix-turn-helix transcriptional regulator, partial [Salmonella enterica]|nr:helix-turn-helix transcriptional regulator [Salmonella enterica]EME7695736.1 helix-turn-helix transcriptional regulator [Salmonella enterica]